MISVLMPYWDRPKATRKALEAMARLYAGVDMEIIIADDGSPVPLVLDTEYPWPVTVLRLPGKNEAKNPCLPFNEAAKVAKGDVLVITNPEILHDSPVFPQMLESLKKLGPNGYVLAACWCPDENKWHCHSTLRPLELHGIQHPKGSGLHFCAMMNRSLWDGIGGFDNAYRDGAGYDDNDLVMKLGAYGAKFMIRDDLVVTHPKNGARTQWPDGSFARNAEIFVGKWKRPVTFCCVQVGNYEGRGAEYVNNLFDMVKRNLSAGYPGRFVCITDDATGLHPDIQVIKAPEGIGGWWVKLWMFKRGVFNEGERVIFMDLDTLVIGELDVLAGYSGQFATLRDFYYPQQVGPAVIAWEVSDLSASIYEEWKACGFTTQGHGDLWWINNLNQGRFAARCDKLQDLYPGMFVSFKAGCNPYPPKAAKVVCFHGQPRPHNSGQKWVDDVWKVGGSSAAELLIVSNTAQERVARNVAYACTLDLPWLDYSNRDGALCIVGGGPSLADDIDELRNRQKNGQKIWALNGCARYLLENGIDVDAQIILDGRAENIGFIMPVASYFIASQCDREIFDAVKGRNVTLFHANTEGIADVIPANGKPLHLISGGSTVGLNTMAIAYTQGYRDIHLFGYDSSYADGHHAYPQPLNDSDIPLDVSVEGEKFKASGWMVAQVNQFQQLAPALAEAGCIITVHGYGLLPFVAQKMSQPIT